MQQDQCPRDDLCSIFHAFLDMICGKLPWGDAARSKDKYNVIEIKNKCYEDISYFINWEVNQTLENENGKVKLFVLIHLIICSNNNIIFSLPLRTCQQLTFH